MAVVALLDACVLLPYQLCDLLLRLAEAGMYRPIWSDDILGEVERNLVSSFDKTPQQARRRVSQMREAFPSAAVDHYTDVIAAMINHPKDRHVAAAAVRAGADILVTANVRDFPPEALDRYDLEVLHPDRFLQNLFDRDPRQTLTCLVEQRAAYTRPHLTVADFYRTLRRTVPVFARLAEELESDPGSAAEAVLPVEIVQDEEALKEFFPSGDPEPTTPLGAAYLWWVALLNLPDHRVALERLSSNPGAWGDYTEAAVLLDGWAMMQNVLHAEDAADKIAYARFMPSSGSSMRAFDAFTVTEFHILTLALCADGWWRVWGLSRNHRPSAAEVLA